jgi:hypothetical protein
LPAGAQPLYCGHPAFELTCGYSDLRPGPAGAYLLFSGVISSERLFHVADISYAKNSMVAALETAFAGDSDCPVPDFNVAARLTNYPFTISAANMRLVFFYNCDVPPELQLPRPCGDRIIGAYISGTWGRKGVRRPTGVSKNCFSVSVPVLEGMEPARLYYERLISDGFLLELSEPPGDCDGCQRMGGECRFVKESFQCVRRPNAAQSNSTSHSGMDHFVPQIINYGSLSTLFLLSYQHLFPIGRNNLSRVPTDQLLVAVACVHRSCTIGPSSR